MFNNFEKALWEAGDFQRQANWDNAMYSKLSQQQEILRMENQRLNSELTHSFGTLIGDIFTDLMTGGK